MRLVISLLLLLFVFSETAAQAIDTTIYEVAAEAPRFPSNCETLDTTAQAKSECAQRALLSYVAGRALYPAEAREANVQGTPVISFVVEKDGTITNPQIVRDPGSGLGSAALRVVQVMQTEVRWRPALREGQPVRFRFNLPVRFRLEDPKPYVMAGNDTVYTDLSSVPEFAGGEEALNTYLETAIDYPEEGLDSCRTGQIVIQLLIHPDYGIKVLDLIDYNYLGFEYWYQAIHAAHGTSGEWTPATYEELSVPTAVDLTFTFLPDNAACAGVAGEYEIALEEALRASQALGNEELDAAIDIMNPVIERFPADAQFRILRGQSFLDANRLQEACTDLNAARLISGVNWFDAITRLICN